MQVSDVPTKMPTPFASGAGGAFRRVVPIPSQIGSDPSQASFTDGFPPNTFEPIASGGTGPYGQDMNGLMLAVTQWLRWVQAGAPVKYDGTFSAAVGGYPKGAIVMSAVTDGLFYLCAADNNTAAPPGAGWSIWGPNGAAGGDLSGSFPNPLIADGVIIDSRFTDFDPGTVLSNLLGAPAPPARNTLADFAAALGAALPGSVGVNGWRTNLDGTITQWGDNTTTLTNPDGTALAIVFPTPFPTQVFSVSGVGYVPTAGVGGNDVWANVSRASVTLSGFSAVFNGSGSSGLNAAAGFAWRAEGR